MRFLVIHLGNSGMAEMYNVGIFTSDDIDEEKAVAEVKAKASLRFNTTAPLYVVALDSLEDGWSYYT